MEQGAANPAKTPPRRHYVNVFFDFDGPGHYDSGPLTASRRHRAFSR